MSQRTFFNSVTHLPVQLEITCTIYTHKHGDLELRYHAYSEIGAESAINAIIQKKVDLIAKQKIPLKGINIKISGKIGTELINQHFASTDKAFKFVKEAKYSVKTYENFALNLRKI